MKTKILASVAAMALGLAAAGAVHAAPITVSSQSGFNASTTGKNVVMNFEGTFTTPSNAPGNQVTGGGFTLTNTAGTSGIYGPPGTAGVAISPDGDSTNFYAVLGGGSATLSGFNSNSTGLSLYVGSLDTYNTVSFFGPGNAPIMSFTGSGLTTNADGSATGAVANRELNFAFNGQQVSSVVFSSTQNAFEFDNIAVSSAPEPGTWALMIAGVGMMGAALRQSRRRREGLHFV